MNRRQFVFASLPAMTLCACGPARAECGGLGHSEFIAMTYQKQARLLAEKTPPNQEEFYSLFSPRMRRLMQEPKRNKNVTLGPVLNVFFGWGVLPGADIKVGPIAMVSGDEMGPATFSVGLKHRGQRRKVLVHVLLDKDEWRIANVIYDSGKSLLEHYRSLSGG